MILDELFECSSVIILETAKPIWARTGDKIVRKYRCVSGRKQGQIVSSPDICGGSVDLKKSMKLKKTMLSKGARIARKAKKTKRINPLSLRVQKMNKTSGR